MTGWYGNSPMSLSSEVQKIGVYTTYNSGSGSITITTRNGSADTISCLETSEVVVDLGTGSTTPTITTYMSGLSIFTVIFYF